MRDVKSESGLAAITVTITNPSERERLRLVQVATTANSHKARGEQRATVIAVPKYKP